ncbi:MAG: N-acetyltransferase, partial [Acinetobacter sp.]
MEKLVRKAHQNDLTDISEIHHKSFIRQADSKQWIASTPAAYPRFFCHVIVSDKTVGYIFWAQKSGFR